MSYEVDFEVAKLIHDMDRTMAKQQMMINVLLMTLCSIALLCCGSSAIINYVDGDIVWAAIMATFAVINGVNLVITTVRFVREYKHMKVEKELFAELEQAYLKILEAKSCSEDQGEL